VNIQPDQAGGATRRKAEARRERIISAARSLFAKHGFDGTGMAEIARVSEVLVGQIYRDFAGKEQLIEAIVERDVKTLLNDPELAAAITSGEEDQLKAWLRSFIARELDAETRIILAEILSEASRNARLAEIVMGASDCLRARIAQAAAIWVPAPDKETQRLEFADIVLTTSGAILYRQIYGLHHNDKIAASLFTLVESKIEELRQHA